MKIITQDNFNECGICCVNMLINYYGQQTKNLKPQLLSQCSLSKYGLNLLELEVLCSQYKITLDTYELSYEELIASKTKNPMILVLKTDGGYHYVIATLKHHQLKIYDPSNKTYTIASKDEFLSWTGYVCFSSANKFKFKPVNITLPLLKNLSFLVTLCFLTFNILEFICNLSLSWLLSRIVNLNFVDINNDSLWKLGFIFILGITIHYGFSFLISYFKTLYAKNNFKHFTNYFFNLLLQKNFYFFECYNKQQILQVFNFSHKLLYFYSFYWSDWFAQVGLLITSFSLLITINSNLWIILTMSMIIKLIIYIYKFHCDFSYQNQVINEQLKFEQKLHCYLEHKQSSWYLDYESNWSQFLNYNLMNLKQNEINLEIKHHWITLFNKFIDMLLMFILIVTLWQTTTFNLGKLFFTLNVYQLFNSSFDQNVQAIKNYYQIKPIYQLLLNFVTTNNLSKCTGIKLLNPQTLTWNNNKLVKNVLINIDQLLDHNLIQQLLTQNNNLVINEHHINNYDQTDLMHKIIFINHDFSLNKETTIQLLQSLEHNSLANLRINWNNFDFQKLSPIHQKYLILFMLTSVQDHIICFNNFFIFNNLDPCICNEYKQLLTKINKQNFIISNDVPVGLIDFYDYQI